MVGTVRSDMDLGSFENFIKIFGYYVLLNCILHQLHGPWCMDEGQFVYLLIVLL